VRVSEAGAVIDVRPVTTSSDTDFSLAALAEVKNFKFNPGQKNGRPVEAWTQIAISPAQ
jgi:outer membrane biosynthesis protein TonB